MAGFAGRGALLKAGHSGAEDFAQAPGYDFMLVPTHQPHGNAQAASAFS